MSGDDHFIIPDNDIPDDDELPPDECLHEDFQFDILTGRATCPYCGEFFYPPVSQANRGDA